VARGIVGRGGDYMEKRISKEQWLELSQKLRQRVSSYFKIEELETIDNFIRHAAYQFDQISQ
jgi:hypothetical protein